MHISNTFGNTITNSDSFTNYKFPAELPTCEWGADEVRSYQNYIRPVSHLFQNDKALKFYIESIFERLTNNDNITVKGCSLTVSSNTFGGSRFVEVGPGVFLYSGKLYEIYPEVKLTQEALDKALALTGSTNHTEINYSNGTFYGRVLDANGGKVYPTTESPSTYITESTGIELLINLDTNCDSFITDSGLDIKSFAPLPILVSANGNVRFNGSTILIDSSTSGTVFGTVSNNVPADSTVKFKINGNKITDDSIGNAKLEHSSITIGSTGISLGQTVSNLAGATINGITVQQATVSGVTCPQITNGTISATFPFSIVFKDAAARDSTDTLTSATSGTLLPSAGAVRNYISGQNLVFNGNNNFSGLTTFASGSLGNTMTITNTGIVTVNNNTHAALTINNVDYTYTAMSDTINNIDGAVVVEGGIACKDSIFVAGDVKGRNVQSVSTVEAKENFSEFTENAIEILKDTKVWNFNYKSDPDKNKKVGIKAEESNEYISTKDHNVLDHANTIALLIKAVQELSDRCDKLEERVKELESR